MVNAREYARKPLTQSPTISSTPIRPRSVKRKLHFELDRISMDDSFEFYISNPSSPVEEFRSRKCSESYADFEIPIKRRKFKDSDSYRVKEDLSSEEDFMEEDFTVEPLSPVEFKSPEGTEKHVEVSRAFDFDESPINLSQRLGSLRADFSISSAESSMIISSPSIVISSPSSLDRMSPILVSNEQSNSPVHRDVTELRPIRLSFYSPSDKTFSFTDN